MMSPKVHVDLEKLFNKAVWAILIAICTFGVKKANDISNNIASLNEKMAVIVVTVGQDKDELKDHESRLRTLERNKTHAPLGD